jgi:precorrin-6Y C5,15-methyltransferase (decarboxylating)
VSRPDGDGRPVVHVIGIHGGEVFGPAARRALAEADVVVGSARHRGHVEGRDGRDEVDLSGPLPLVLDRIDAAAGHGRRVAVLSSGDPGFFGIVRLMAERFGPDAIEVHPAPSSVSLAFGRIGLTWDDAVVVSAHGRPLDAAVDAAVRWPKVAVLTAPTQPPELLGRALLAAGCPPRSVAVASRLGEAGERLVRTDLDGLAAGTFDPMSVVVLVEPGVAAGPAPATTWGLGEDHFAHRNGMITKAEVRAIALAKLELPRRGVLWDVGAGSGSVGVEAARLAPGLQVFAIERNPDDAARVGDNARRHGVALSVVASAAPAAFAELPTPDRVFVGGGGLDVLEAAWERLRPGGRLVATHAMVDRAAAAWRLLGDLVEVSVARGVPIADGVRLAPENPVFVSWGTR